MWIIAYFMERKKSFEPGDNVKIFIFYLTFTNKLLSRWHGPCSILQKRSEFMVDKDEAGREWYM